MKRFLGLCVAVALIGGVVTLLWAFPFGRNYSFSLLGENFSNLSRKDLLPLLEIVEKKWREKPLALRVGEQAFLVDKKKLGITWNLSYMRNIILKGQKEIPLSLTFDEGRVKKLLQEIAQKIALPPQDAFFKEKRFFRSQEGRTLNIEKSLAEFQEKLESGAETVELTQFTMIPPQRDTASLLTEKGFPYLLARYETSLENRDEDVIFNIQKAAATIDGVLIPKGTVFSFNQKV
ncbi:MAG: peptidoglycan binding domain-containing protein, partial [Candidatus Caldatribacteriaceae bacterium]